MADVYIVKDYVKRFSFSQSMSLTQWYSLLSRQRQHNDLVNNGLDIGCLIYQQTELIGCIKHYYDNPIKTRTRGIHMKESGCKDFNECPLIRKYLSINNSYDGKTAGNCIQCHKEHAERALRGELLVRQNK
jgi:hypothetical protein